MTTRALTSLTLNDVDKLDQLIEFLENLRADVHLPVQEGTLGGSGAFDEGRRQVIVSEAGVLGTSGEGDRTGELPEDERPLLLGSDVQGSTDEGVYDGSPEETCAVSPEVARLFIIRDGILEHLAQLDEMKAEGLKLLAENTRLGGLAVARWKQEIMNAE